MNKQAPSNIPKYRYERRDKMFTRNRIVAIAVVLGICLLFSVVAIADSHVEAPRKEWGPINGVNYSLRASAISVDGWGVTGTSQVGTADHTTVPAGWMGIRSFLFDEYGRGVANSGWYYNSGESIGIGQHAFLEEVEGIFYCQGEGRAYNGDGYDSENTYKTPMIAWSDSEKFSNSSPTIQNALPDPVFKVNKNGETYGSLMSAGIAGQYPDLISARGVDGTSGYVKKEDMNLDYTPKTPEEALAFQKSKKNSPRTIPLYDVDGKTVIGKYRSNVGQSFDIKK